MQLARALAHGTLAALVASACASAARPPAAGSATRAAGATTTPSPSPETTTPSPAPPERRGYAAGDVAFMQHMIGHHAQALTMSALVPERSRSEAVRMLAERITVSQRDEMAMMRRWLEARHEAVPMEGMDGGHPMEHMPGMAHGAAGGESHPMSSMLMPGMLTPEEMARLAGATGADFDRLFLQGMIRHHEGALTMVASLFASTGAAQEPELFRLASDVDADQRAEIARMRTLLSSLGVPQ